MQAGLRCDNVMSTVKGFIKDHPYWSIFAGIIAFKLAADAIDGLIDWMKQVKPREDLKRKKLPIVYSPDYNFSVFGLEKVHPFDAKKYQRIHHYLTKHVGIPEECFTEPIMVSRDDLNKVHNKDYLDVLEGNGAAKLTCQIIGLPMDWALSDESFRSRFLNPMRLATGGTIQAAQLAMNENNKWAINIGGGYHHCKGNGCSLTVTKSGYGYSVSDYLRKFLPTKQDEGHGFCVYGDIQLAIEKLWETNSNLKVMIVDLDAHQGNGHEAYFKDKVQLNGRVDFNIEKREGKVAIFDMYGDYNYPYRDSEEYITYPFRLQLGIQDTEYLKILKENLPKAIAQFKPDFILYNAGTDILDGDPLGRLKVSQRGVIARDQFVFEQTRDNNIPIAMVTSGGYTKQSAIVIAHSIENILKNVLNIIS